RSGRQRFRGVRLVHTHLSDEPLTRDDLTDLALLRLDLIAAIGVEHGPTGHHAGQVYLGHLLPENPEGALWRTLPPVAAHSIGSVDFDALIRSLEDEFTRRAGIRTAAPGRERAVLVYVDTPATRNGAQNGAPQNGADWHGDWGREAAL